jgi:hypothetical protein
VTSGGESLVIDAEHATALGRFDPWTGAALPPVPIPRGANVQHVAVGPHLAAATSFLDGEQVFMTWNPNDPSAEITHFPLPDEIQYVHGGRLLGSSATDLWLLQYGDTVLLLDRDRVRARVRGHLAAWGPSGDRFVVASHDTIELWSHEGERLGGARMPYHARVVALAVQPSLAIVETELGMRVTLATAGL